MSGFTLLPRRKENEQLNVCTPCLSVPVVSFIFRDA